VAGWRGHAETCDDRPVRTDGGTKLDVGRLLVAELLYCTQPPPAGAYGPGHRNVGLSPHWPGMLVLDVVDDLIMFVKVTGRPPLD
jgi:hypothetical protein